MNLCVIQKSVGLLTFGILLSALPACDRAAPTAPDVAGRAAAAAGDAVRPSGDNPSTVNAQLAELRRLTAHFHDLEDAMEAGYSVQVTPCLELAGVGGMGFHYGNPAFINNSTVSLLQPELLLYEPQKNGRLRFVGIEYIIPFDQLPSTATPPTLLGQSLHADLVNGLWALHVWVGRENPTGMFEDWNPQVSCQFAE